MLVWCGDGDGGGMGDDDGDYPRVVLNSVDGSTENHNLWEITKP